MMNTKEEFLKILNKIEKYIKEEKYIELKEYVQKKKFELNMREDDKASDYIDNLLNDLDKS